MKTKTKTKHELEGALIDELQEKHGYKFTTVRDDRDRFVLWSNGQTGMVTASVGVLFVVPGNSQIGELMAAHYRTKGKATKAKRVKHGTQR